MVLTRHYVFKSWRLVSTIVLSPWKHSLTTGNKRLNPGIEIEADSLLAVKFKERYDFVAHVTVTFT